MTELYLELESALPTELDPERLSGLAGLVVDGTCLTPEQCAPLPAPVRALRGGAGLPEEWREAVDAARIVEGGLETCARLRDEQPEHRWLPRLQVCRQEVLYRMTDSPGEGFRFYTPDTAAIRGYRVTGDDLPLPRALARAEELGFDRLWLHGLDAALHGNGLDLDLLEKARILFDGELWFSGGAREPRHQANLAREGGTFALVIDAALLEEVDAATLAAALAPPSPPSPGVQVEFSPRAGKGA